MSYDNWKMTEPDVCESEDERSKREWEDTHFPCACGDEQCHGDNRDADNIKIGRAWYAADCPMGNQLDQIVSGRVAALTADERQGK